jgi:hypothetical protein
MLEASFAVGPKTESLRQRLLAPFSLVVSPGAPADLFSSPIDCDHFPRCAACGAYYSSLCQREASAWTCGVCGKQTSAVIPEDFPAIADCEIAVDEPLGLEVTVLYLSLDFHHSDIRVIQPAVLSFLSALEDRPLIVFLGHSDAPVAVLVPYAQCYATVDGMVVYRPPEGLSEVGDLPAPILLLNDPSKIDFTSFIFAPSQIPTICQTLRRLENVSTTISFAQLLDLSTSLSKRWAATPIHVIAIVPAIGAFTNKCQPLYQRHFRLDILTASYSLYVQHSTSVVPGLELIFTRNSLLRLLKLLVAERTIYQFYTRARSRGVSTTWRSPSTPVGSDEQGRHFAPVLPFNRQPFTLDAKPDGKSTTAVVQITAKMVLFKAGKFSTVIRIFNRRFALSENPQEVAASVDPRVLVWLWLTRTLEESVRNVIAGLFRATAAVLQQLPPDSPKAAELTASCCAIKFSHLASEVDPERFLARYALCLQAPSQIALWPVYSADAKVAVYGNVVYTDSDANEAAVKALCEIPIGAVLRIPIPPWCITADRKSVAFLTSLMH